MKAGEAALAGLGAPVRKVPYLASEPPAVERIFQPWIENNGLLALPPGATLTFDFETKPKWNLVKGAFWQPPDSSTPGHICLTGVGSDNYGYKAVGPYVSVGPGEVIRVTGKAKHFKGARLHLRYYLADSSPRCFGHLMVQGHAVSDSPEFVPFQFEFTLAGYTDLRFIALILYCQHADGTDPQEGDTILIDELSISRGG